LSESQPWSFKAVQPYFSNSPAFLALSSLAQFAAIVLSVWLAGRFLDRRRFVDFGLHLDRNWWIDLGFGLLLGAVLMLFIFVVELTMGWVRVTGTFVSRIPNVAFPVSLLPAIGLFLLVGIQEELFSRGYQLQNLAEGLSGGWLGPRAAVLVAALLSSAVFGALHLGNPNASLVSTLSLFLVGAILLATGRLLTGQLAIPIGIHITWNFFQGNVFGFPVSGGNYRWGTFMAIQQGGPDAWTGGLFGPEAGLLGVAATLLGGLLILGWVRWRYGRVALNEDLAWAPERSASE
jgi:membrane protease YdiL (CAAX protease family)